MDYSHFSARTFRPGRFDGIFLINSSWKNPGIKYDLFYEYYTQTHLPTSVVSSSDINSYYGGLNYHLVSKNNTPIFKAGVFANDFFLLGGEDGLVSKSSDGSTWNSTLLTPLTDYAVKSMTCGKIDIPWGVYYNTPECDSDVKFKSFENPIIVGMNKQPKRPIYDNAKHLYYLGKNTKYTKRSWSIKTTKELIKRGIYSPEFEKYSFSTDLKQIFFNIKGRRYNVEADGKGRVLSQEEIEEGIPCDEKIEEVAVPVVQPSKRTFSTKIVGDVDILDDSVGAFYPKLSYSGPYFSNFEDYAYASSGGISINFDRTVLAYPGGTIGNLTSSEFGLEICPIYPLIDATFFLTSPTQTICSLGLPAFNLYYWGGGGGSGGCVPYQDVYHIFSTLLVNFDMKGLPLQNPFEFWPNPLASKFLPEYPLPDGSVFVNPLVSNSNLVYFDQFLNEHTVGRSGNLPAVYIDETIGGFFKFEPWQLYDNPNEHNIGHFLESQNKSFLHPITLSCFNDALISTVSASLSSFGIINSAETPISTKSFGSMLPGIKTAGRWYGDTNVKYGLSGFSLNSPFNTIFRNFNNYDIFTYFLNDPGKEISFNQQNIIKERRYTHRIINPNPLAFPGSWSRMNSALVSLWESKNMLVNGYTVTTSEIVPGISINFNTEISETVNQDILHPWITTLVSSLSFETTSTQGIPNSARYLTHVTNSALSTVYPIASSLFKCSPFQHFSNIRRDVLQFNDAFLAAHLNWWLSEYPDAEVPYPGCNCQDFLLQNPAWWSGFAPWGGTMTGTVHYEVIPDIEVLMIDWDHYHRYMFSVWDIPLTFEEEVALNGIPKTPVSNKILNTDYLPASASTTLSTLSCEHEAVLVKTYDGETWVITNRIPNFIISNIIYADLPPVYDRPLETPITEAQPRNHSVNGNYLIDGLAYTWHKYTIFGCGFDIYGNANVGMAPRVDLGVKLFRQKGWFLVVGYDVWTELDEFSKEQTYYQANTILLNQDGQIVEYDYENSEEYRLKLSTFKEARNKPKNSVWTSIYTPQTSIHQEQWLNHLNVHGISYEGNFYISNPGDEVEDPTQIVYRKLKLTVGETLSGEARGSNSISLSTTILNKDVEWLSDTENTLLDYGGYIQYLTIPQDSYLSYYNGNGLFTYSPVGLEKPVFYTADFSRVASLIGDYDIGGVTLSSIVMTTSYENINQTLVLPQTCLKLNSYLYQPYVSLYGKGVYVVAGMERVMEKDESLLNPVTLHKGASSAFSKLELNGYIATSTSKRQKQPGDFRISILEHRPDKLLIKTTPALFRNSNIILTLQVSSVEMTLVYPSSSATTNQPFSSIDIFALSAYNQKIDNQIIPGQSYFIGESDADLFLFENVGFSNLDITIYSEKYDSMASVKVNGYDSLWNAIYLEQNAAVPPGINQNPYSNFIYLISGDQQFLNVPLLAKAAYADPRNNYIYTYNTAPSTTIVWEWWWTDGPYQTVDLNVSNITATSLTNSQPYSAGTIALMNNFANLNLSIAAPRKRSDFYAYDAPGLLKIRVSAPEDGVSEEFLFEIESPHYFYSRNPVYFKNGTPTTLDKDGTGLWNTVMYTNGEVNTPSQNAIVLHYSGFGNGIIGNQGIFYFDGYPSTTINGYYSAGYFVSGARVKTPSAFPLNIHKAVNDNNLWYIYNQYSPYSTMPVTFTLTHFSPELNYDISKVSNSWVKTPATNDETVTIVPSGVYYSVQTTSIDNISANKYYFINNFGVAEFMLTDNITNLDLVAGSKILSASYAYQFGTGHTLKSITAINFVPDGVSYIKDMKTLDASYYMVSSGLASIVSGVRIDVPGYTDFYYQWNPPSLPYKIESNGYYQLVPYDNKWCFLTVYDEAMENVINTVSVVTGTKLIVQIANAYYEYGPTGSSNPTLPADGTEVIDENGPLGAGIYTINYEDPSNPTFETQSYTFVEGLPG